MLNILSKEQLAFYKEHDYVLVKGVIPDQTIHLMRNILSRWIDDLIVKWYEEGLLNKTLHEVEFAKRLVEAWNLAGRPRYSRSPRRDIVSPYMYEFFKTQAILDVASDLLETSEVSVHGIFNARPKLPDQTWTNTPWHQDAQYYRDAAKSHVVSMWMPLQKVDDTNSCLQVAPGFYKNKIVKEDYLDETGFIGLTKEDAATLDPLSIHMEVGDILCFNQFMPHRALPNNTDSVRWSLDLRYEPTAQATETGKQQGFIARSTEAPESETSYQDWMKQWKDIPLGSY